MSIEMTAAMAAEEVISVLQTLQKVTGTGGALGATGLAALDAALTSLISGMKGDIDTVTVLAQVGAITASLVADDDKADSALDAKFKGQ